MAIKFIDWDIIAVWNINFEARNPKLETVRRAHRPELSRRTIQKFKGSNAQNKSCRADSLFSFLFW